MYLIRCSTVRSGQLAVLLRHVRESDVGLPAATVRRLEQMKTLATAVSDAAMPYTRRSQPEYYARKSLVKHTGKTGGFCTIDITFTSTVKQH